MTMYPGGTYPIVADEGLAKVQDTPALEALQAAPVPQGDVSGKQAMIYQPSGSYGVRGVLSLIGDGIWGWDSSPLGPGLHGEGPNCGGRAPGVMGFPSLNGLPIAWPWQYAWFRRILSDASVRFIRTLSYSPIMATKWVMKAKKNAPKGAMDAAQINFDELRMQFIDDALRAVDYGWAPFEQCFESVQGGQYDGMVWLKKIKPLLHDITSIYITKHGEFVGFNNHGTTIDPVKAVLFNYDAEGGNLYGRGRCYNLLKIMPWWEDANEGAAQYDRKIAGVFMVCHYPPGQSYNKDNELVDNFEIAREMLNAVVAGRPIAVCNEFAGMMMDENLQNVSLADRTRWKLELLEDKGSRQPGFNERLTYLDKQKARGWQVPERAAFEAQKSGSRADSESQGNIVLVEGEVISQRLCRLLSGGVMEKNSCLNNWLRVNYGDSAVGTLCIEPIPLEDDKKKFLRDIVRDVFVAEPTLFPVCSSVIDACKEAGLPPPTDPLDDSKVLIHMQDSIAMQMQGPVTGDIPEASEEGKKTLARIQERRQMRLRHLLNGHA